MGLLSDKTFPVEIQYTSTHLRYGAYKIDQSMGITTARLGEPVNFIEVTDGNMGEELLKGTKISQRQLHQQSPPMPGSSAQKQESGIYSTGWRMFFPCDLVLECKTFSGNLVVICFFEAAWHI